VIVAVALSLTSVAPVMAQRDIRVGLRGYVEQKINIAIDKPQPESPAGQEVAEILAHDLEFSLRFNVLAGQPQTAVVRSSSPVDYEVWAIFGTEYLVTGTLESTGAGFSAEIVLHHVPFRQEIQTLRFSLPAPGDDGFRAAVHDLSNAIIRDLTGEQGIADTRIAFASRRRGDKEIYVSDYDGRDSYRVTQLDTISMTPDWRPDGSEICFMSFVVGDPDLYCAPAEGGRARPISSNKGLDMAPAWSPEGDRLAHTLTKDGNPEIYVRNPSGRRLRRLTYNLGIDTAPSWSPNGRMLVFVSDRTATSQIYTMDAEGADLRQITFGGEAHSPAWSPLGDRIAYVERIDGRFQVVTIDPDGGNRTVLTFTGDNEDPSWSPDGLHFAFSSSRAGGTDIYTMDWDGNNIRRVTEGGAYLSPSWSARLRPSER
jgi:TolB protein